MEPLQPTHITIDKLAWHGLADHSVQADVLRLDKLHPLVSGNKWFKLRYYIDEAIRQHHGTLVTFGGAWSNHLLATAAAGKMFGLRTVGILRGEESPEPSATIKQLRELGMELYFISRQDYRMKKIPPSWPEENYLLIPEGGYGETGAKGAATLADPIQKNTYTHWCCAAGTGTMTAGLLRASQQEKIISISVLRNHRGLQEDIIRLAPGTSSRLSVIHDHHFGGYARFDNRLTGFMNTLYEASGIPTDIVYTGKLFYAFHELLQTGYFPPGSRVLLIHSGGLQGNRSLSNGTLIFA